MMRTRPQYWIATVMVATLASQSGCAMFGAKKTDDTKPKSSFADKMPWKKKDDTPKPYPNPVKMAVTWTPDTLTQTGRTPTRGFGGRIYFYDEKAHAVPVEGTLVVHGINESAKDPAQRVKRFEFTPEQFTRHFSQTDLGASYSVWVPWDAVGGDMERISLVASFQPVAEERPVQSSPSVVVLPGRNSAQGLAEYKTPLSPDYERWREATAAVTPAKSGVTTTTIQRRRTLVTSPKQLEASPSSTSGLARGQATPTAEIPMAQKAPAVEATVIPTSGWSTVP